MTVICLCGLCGLCRKFGNSDVSGNCRVVVHKPNIAYRSASDICSSVIKSSLSISSLGFFITFVLIIWVFIPLGFTSILRVNKVCVVCNDIWKGSKLSVNVFCVVVSICWKCFMDHVHIIISFEYRFF